MAASVADAAVNPNGIKTLSGNGLSTFFIISNPVFNNGPKSLPKNPPDRTISCNWVFDNFVLAEELFAKALWSFETCVLVSNNLCRKLFSSLELPTTFHENFKVASVPFFVPDFNLLSCEFDNFTVKCCIESCYTDIILKLKNHNTLTVPWEKSKIVSLAFSIMKKTILLRLHLVLDFQYNQFVVLLLDQHHALFVYLNLSLSVLIEIIII